MSKVGTLSEVLKEAGASDPMATSLTQYHAAKGVVNALRCKDPFETLRRAKAALKRFNVRVELTAGLLVVSTFNRSHVWNETGAVTVAQ